MEEFVGLGGVLLSTINRGRAQWAWNWRPVIKIYNVEQFIRSAVFAEALIVS